MKKVRVSLWVDTCQKERLTELSRKERILISEYIQEAIEDLLKKYEEPRLKLVHDGEDSGEKEIELKGDNGLMSAERAGGS